MLQHHLKQHENKKLGQYPKRMLPKFFIIFSPIKCLSVNNEEDATDVQMIVNTLEEKNNQYIFDVSIDFTMCK